jgi:S1-C subfamily serine protease
VTPESGNAIVRAVRLIGPAVVNVDTTFGPVGNSEFLPDPGRGVLPPEGKGTGVVIDTRRGLMLTNAHVVAGAKRIQITTRDGVEYSGQLVGSDRQSDIAVVKLSSRNLPQARLAMLKNGRDLDVGAWAIAIGNPFAQANTVTVGVVSAVGRTIPVPPGKDGQAFQLTDMIQTDAAINPGNSGGPLCNIHGEVIGINTAIISHPFATGLGFAIPINKAKAIADQLITKGRVQHPYIGVGPVTISEAVRQDYGLADRNGALVRMVPKGSPAEKAGLKEGDVIRKLDGQPVKDRDDVLRIIGGKSVGSQLKAEILRNNTVKRQLTIKVGDRPDN